jgi:hypothetical protein
MLRSLLQQAMQQGEIASEPLAASIADGIDRARAQKVMTI